MKAELQPELFASPQCQIRLVQSVKRHIEVVIRVGGSGGGGGGGGGVCVCVGGGGLRQILNF